MQDINHFVNLLNQSGVIIFPTDTAYGIGCRIDRPDAIGRLFSLRRRPETKSVPVLVSDIKMAKKYLTPLPRRQAGLPQNMENLMQKFWPGALTIVYGCKTELVPELVRGGGSTLGVRMPKHEALLDLINRVGVPIIGTSANFSGEPTPYFQKDLNPELIKLVDGVMPGDCLIREASTVVDCTVTPWKILRQGSVKLEL